MTDGLDITRPHCPQCQSFHVTEISKRSLILAGIGAGLGGLLMIFLMQSSSKNEKTESVSPIVLAIFTGAMAGFTFSNPGRDESAGHGYLCLDCFHYFTFLDCNKE